LAIYAENDTILGSTFKTGFVGKDFQYYVV